MDEDGLTLNDRLMLRAYGVMRPLGGGGLPGYDCNCEEEHECGESRDDD
jgi:hypothetical protein